MIEEVEQNIRIIGQIFNVTYPKSGFQNGGWAVFSVFMKEITEGQIYREACSTKNGTKIVRFSGETPSLKYNTDYIISGHLVESKYGYQYEVDVMAENYNFDSEEGKRVFLQTILPEATIDSLFRHFEDPFELIKNHNIPELVKVRGVGPITAAKIIDKYEKNIVAGPAYVKLNKYGLTKHMIDRLIMQYRSPEKLVRAIEENPYVLIDEATGIGWAKADAMAMNAGIPENSPFRIKAFAKYYLGAVAEGDGHTWVTDRDLYDHIKAIVPNDDPEHIGECIKELIAGKELYHDEDGKRIGLMMCRRLEENIAHELFRIKSGSCHDIDYVEETIARCEEKVGFEYTEEQKAIIKNICGVDQVSVVTGLAGCGKSSIMFPITQIFARNYMQIAQCALSGKASLNLSEITGIPGKTIHKLLGYSGDGTFEYDEGRKMPYDIVIVDELSMVGGYVFYSLLRAVKDGAKLIVIGDPGQLESIGLCNCLWDMSESGVLPHYHLTKIMRQAENSAIITESFKVYNKEQIIPNGFSGEITKGLNQDFKIISAFDGEDSARKIIEQFKDLYENKNISIEDIMIAVSKRCAGSCSARVINEKVHAIVSRQEGRCVECHYIDKGTKYSIQYYVGDRILVMKNAYDTVSTAGDKTPVYNGNVGTITEIDRDGMVTARFIQGEVILSKEKMQNVQLGYAITTHRLQGSGIPYVIAVCDPGAYTLNSKEMLYTQITRAKKLCILIGPADTIRNATSKTHVKKKQTWLKELLQGGVDIEEKLDPLCFDEM